MSAAPPIPAEAGASDAPAVDSEIAPLRAPPAPTASDRREWPQPGAIWLERYQVRAALGDVALSRTWSAVRIDTMEEVIVRAVSGTAAGRRAEAWAALEKISHPALVRAWTSHESGGHRFEVQATNPGEPLDAWRARRELEPSALERLVRSVADALGALHENGLVHFGVRPKNIFVQETAGALEFVLGGLETVTEFARDKLVPMPVDPLNAPPEAAGLFQHSPGPGLCAWDWWSLGRVVQEVVLGEHVLGRIMQRDVATPFPELLARAEALLLERDAGAMRAGAVEAMPAMDKRLELLLRGLLTSARDARWDGDCVARWLRREPVRELYRLPRNERMFRWHDRAYAVSEVAGLLRSAEHWGEAMENIWAHEKPGTLGNFLIDSPAHHALAARLDELRKLETVFALKALPREIVREAIATVALLELAGDGCLGWRGRRFDEESFQKTFGEESDDIDRLALLQAFTARPIVLPIERCDMAAARVLTEFAHVAAGAETLARQNRWLTDRDLAGRARLLRTALRSLAELRAAARTLHERFACSTESAAEKLFNLPQPGRPELAALAWIGGEAERRGFLTHVQWAERELARLRSAAHEEATNLAWLQLARALTRGPWLFARWRWLIPAWLLWAPPALILWPGARWVAVACAPLVLGTLVRIGVVFYVRRIVRNFAPEARRWSWRDGVARCREELGAYRAGRSIASVRKALDEVNAEIAKLTVLQPPPARVPAPARCTGVWALAAASWILFLAGLSLAGWWGKTHRPSWSAIERAWNPPAATAADLAAKKAAEAAAAEKVPLGPTKISWSFKPGDEAQKLLINDSIEARPEQLRFVAARGRQLADRYKVETINTLVILRVPVKDKIGLMIYDGAQQQLVNTKVYLLDYAPLAKAWVEVAGRPGIYLPD